jgi:hypothetical protein
MLGILVFMSHVMPAMFCCALPRYVFIKNCEGGFLDTLTEDMTGANKTDDEYTEVVAIQDDRSSIRTDFSGSSVNENEDFVKADADAVSASPDANI